MSNVRMTNKPQMLPGRTAQRPDGAPQPVAGCAGLEGDPQRLLREAHDAPEKRPPRKHDPSQQAFPPHEPLPIAASLADAPSGTSGPTPDIHALTLEISHLGEAARRLVHAMDEASLQRILSAHVDEQA